MGRGKEVIPVAFKRKLRQLKNLGPWKQMENFFMLAPQRGMRIDSDGVWMQMEKHHFGIPNISELE